MPVRLSVYISVAPTGRISMKFDIDTACQENSNVVKIGQNVGHLHEDDLGVCHVIGSGMFIHSVGYLTKGP
jgi:hypothetical protein